ncbi:hypothetical protein KAR91_83895 [Candidatus Pacearchaeota archaeon]|nr:hypothetical protein [Candidatus Pacearchaeota archaeon]
MKKLKMRLKTVVAVCLIVGLCASAFGCGNTKIVNGIEYDTYGLMDKDEKKNEKIQYEIIWGNVVWGVALCQTLIAPVYFFGFSLWEPVGVKTDIKGQVPQT